MKTIFDFGMFDASDTIYYLEKGFKVVAIEANPGLCDRARGLLKRSIENGSLELLNVAIGSTTGDVELTVCGDDLGSSSIYGDTVSARTPIGRFTVPGTTTQKIIEQFGTPYYFKIDLEGVDVLCVKSLTAATKPEFLSCEVDDKLPEFVTHLETIGFKNYKLINQTTFREIANRNILSDRIARKIVRSLGFAEPQYVRRSGRLFKVAHSSGPVPWESDGRWSSSADLLKKWSRARNSNLGNAWFDLHAK